MNLIKNLFNKIKTITDQNQQIRSASVLAVGSAFGSSILLMAMPLITRLYTPAEFSVLALFTSIVSIASVGSCLRLDIAIPLPKKDTEAVNLLAVALGINCISSIILALFLWIFFNDFVYMVGDGEIKEYFWLIPIGVFVSGSYGSFQMWATRKKKFVTIAKTRIFQSISSVALQIGIAYSTSAGAIGLLVGQVIYMGSGSIGIIRNVFLKDKRLIGFISIKSMVSVFRKYDNFPKYSTFESLANSGSTDIPLFIIGTLAVGPEVGFLFLAMKVMVVPIGLISRSIGSVYFSHASKKFRDNKLTDFTVETIDNLVKTGVGPLAFIGISSPFIVPIVFGVEWARSGDILFIITPWIIAQFLTSPISSAFVVTSLQKNSLNLQMAGLILRVVCTFVAIEYMPEYVVVVFASASFVFYLFYLFNLLKVCNVKVYSIFMIINKNRRIIGVWVLTAILVDILLKYFR